jgi:hypothetical protein
MGGVPSAGSPLAGGELRPERSDLVVNVAELCAQDALLGVSFGRALGSDHIDLFAKHPRPAGKLVELLRLLMLAM